MTAFTPDPNSRPSKVADYVQNTLNAAGDVVTYPELADLIGVDWDPDDNEVKLLISGVVGDVNDRLYKRGDWRRLHSVPNVGYKIASPADLYDETVNRDLRAMRQVSRGLAATSQVIIHPDASMEDRRRAVDVAAARGELLAAIRAKQRSIRGQWPRPETSPVVLNGDDDED